MKNSPNKNSESRRESQVDLPFGVLPNLGIFCDNVCVFPCLSDKPFKGSLKRKQHTEVFDSVSFLFPTWKEPLKYLICSSFTRENPFLHCSCSPTNRPGTFRCIQAFEVAWCRRLGALHTFAFGRGRRLTGGTPG